MSDAQQAQRKQEAGIDTSHKLVIFASSLGTVFEWYDFYIFGTLAVFFSKAFFPAGNETAAYLSSLALFGVGFSVRPFGALVFGRIGDMIGRKYTFLVTIMVMGLSTAVIGFLPGYATLGWWAPITLVLLRLAQGLALGGEYGGAATYVAEHAPHGKRGIYTSWIQTTATLGLFMSLGVIGTARTFMTAAAFNDWGWRIPFLFSFVLLAVSVYIRLKLSESPVYAEMKAQGKGSKAPPHGQLRQLGQRQVCHWCSARCDRRPRRSLVCWSILRFVLPDDDAKAVLHRRLCAAFNRPSGRSHLPRLLRLALRQDRPQIHHDGWLRPRDSHLSADLP